MDFTAIKQLRLKEAFKSDAKFSVISTDEDYLNTLFETKNNSHLFVYDSESLGHSTFITNTYGIGSDKVFNVANNTRKDVFLWHIDGVLYARDSKCDCALISDTDLKFVEFKSEAAQNSLQAIEDNYNKAYKQLSITFKDIDSKCKSAGVDMRKIVNIKAYAVFNRTVPSDNATQKNLKTKFLKEHGVKLLFKNETSM